MRERNAGKALLPLVQLLPAAALGAAVLLTLPHTVPVLAEVPERLVPAAEAASDAAPAEVEEVVMPKLPYPDGVYTGSSRGYGGTVKVQVTMENGTITDLQIIYIYIWVKPQYIDQPEIILPCNLIQRISFFYYIYKSITVLCIMIHVVFPFFFYDIQNTQNFYKILREVDLFSY